MKTFQKIILVFLAMIAIVVGYFSFEFVHGFSSGNQSAGVQKVEAKDVPTIINVALIGSDARSKEEEGRSDSLMVAQYNQKKQKKQN